MKMQRGTFVAIVTIGAGIIGCGDVDESAPELTDQISNEIRGGTFVNPFGGGDPMDGAVRIGSRLAYSDPAFAPLGNPFCSGVKIGPRRFVLAAHCFVGIFAEPSHGARVMITNKGCHPPRVAGDGCSHATGLAEISVDRFYIHSTYLVNPPDRANDVAVLDVLSDTPEIPTAVLDDSLLPDGSDGTLIAYGCNTSGITGLGRRQLGVFVSQSLAEVTADYPLDGVTATASELYSRYIVADARMSFPSDLQGCGGDSGGPLFAFRAAGPRVAGIASFITATVGNPNARITALARVSPVVSWLRAPTIKGQRGSITHALTGRCLSALGSTTRGSAVKLDFCDGRAGTLDTQYWRVTTNAFGLSTIQNGKSGLCLTSTGVNDAAVVQETCQSNDSQRWMIAPGVGTTTRSQLTNQLSGRRLGFRCISNPCTSDARLDQGVDEGTNRQRWLIAPS